MSSMMKFPLVYLFVYSAFLGCTLSTAKAQDNSSAWVNWDRATDRVISHTDKSAAYPRAKRLSNGEILLGYHHGAQLGQFGTWVTLRKSRDDGNTWYMTKDVEGPEAEDFWGFTNPDFVELDSGRMLLVSAGRGRAEPGETVFLSECKRSELRLRFSDDYGATWSRPQSVVRGRGRLWEPSLVRLPNGEIEIYYANEAPDLVGKSGLNQRIELIRSSDQGKTWSDPLKVSYHPGMRNGMPSSVLLRNGRVAIAQEIVRDSFSPWITQTLPGQILNKEEYVAQRRYGFGGAPYLLVVTDGSILLAFHSSHQKPPAPDGAKVPWMFGNVWVLKGNAEAKNFDMATRPWPDVDVRTGVFYASLMMKDEKTVVALASFLSLAQDNTSRTVVRWIEGKLK